MTSFVGPLIRAICPARPRGAFFSLTHLLIQPVSQVAAAPQRRAAGPNVRWRPASHTVRMAATPAPFNLSGDAASAPSLYVEVDLTPANWVLAFCMGIISVVTVFGNLIVLLSYYLDKNIRHPSNYFIFSLAISDLIIGLEGIPVYTYFFIKDQHWPFGTFLCDLWLSIDYSCCLASIYTVLGITIDRYCSVKYPAAYRNWRTQPRVLSIIAATWIIPSVLFSVSIFGYGAFSGKGRILKDDECYVQFMTDPYLNMSMYIAYYWSTLFVMLYLYYGIYKAAKALAVKSDQKQKRLAILSEMRKSKKELPSTMNALSEGVSNSAAESQPDTNSDSNSRNNLSKVAQGNGKVAKATNCNNNEIPNSNCVKKSPDKPEPETTLEKSEKSWERIIDYSTIQEPSVAISVMPIENDDISLAFSIVDEIPFIDDGNIATKSFIKRAKTPIPLKEYRKTPSRSPSPPTITQAQTPPSPQKEEPILPEPVAPQPLSDRNNNSTYVHNHTANSYRPQLKKYAADRPSTFTSMDTPPLSTTNTFASLSVVVEKAANGPMTMRRLLTVMRHSSAGKPRKKRQATHKKTVQSKSENRAKKALRTITFILGSFTILWTPFYVLATVYGFCERCKVSNEFNLSYAISYYLCYMNSPLNPICYAFANQQFKRAFKRILRGDFRRT
ncbi:unnamed protein product [Bursaphelenchus xylophilus]|uniref:(pine wood nematode) hypothetical protein n=1 Tax=Bursaphelenchus xylophilus TaxID=6326 RepID=A0A1I7SQM8_BURXY|nr:unnamed protein product [Bursaphelenchus xylophilus]CAG9110119.1 unnamed protein product [Bursaphelenchus xylophilus]